MASSITDYLLKHGINPSPKFLDEWARDNWHDWEAVEKQLGAARGRVKDGKIWDDSNDGEPEENDYLTPLNPPEYEARPIIKTEETTGPRGGLVDRTRKTTPFDPLQMANLQDRYGRKPGETETEYLWRVCLTGGDRILLNGEEANGFWGPGVFLNSGPEPANGPHSITSRVAYWAGGIDVLERGEPLVIPIKSLSDISTAITKAACIQAMHDRGPRDIPISAEVNHEILKPLIKGAPAMLKPYLIAKRDRIRRDAEFNAQLVGEPIMVPREIPTWAMLMHDIINHGREMGWSDLSSEVKKPSRNIRQIKQLQDNPQKSESTIRQPIVQGWKELYNQALALGIPKVIVQRQTAYNIQNLIHAILKRDEEKRKEYILNAQVPLPAPRKRDSPFSQNSESKNE